MRAEQLTLKSDFLQSPTHFLQSPTHNATPEGLQDSQDVLRISSCRLILRRTTAESNGCGKHLQCLLENLVLLVRPRASQAVRQKLNKNSGGTKLSRGYQLSSQAAARNAVKAAPSQNEEAQNPELNVFFFSRAPPASSANGPSKKTTNELERETTQKALRTLARRRDAPPWVRCKLSRLPQQHPI